MSVVHALGPFVALPKVPTPARIISRREMLLRSRSTGILLPFLAFSLLLAVPTFIYLSLQASGPPVDDSLTSVNANKLFQVGDEVSGDVIMPKLGNATVKWVSFSTHRTMVVTVR